MDEDVVIKVEGLSKKFCRSLKQILIYGSWDILRDMLGIGYDKSQLRAKEFHALKDVSFEIKKGETFGLVGANGCGKTTLLRLLNGIFPPDTGKITVKGRVGALIAVGAGFHPHMTGRENIYLNGTILGMTRQEIDARLDDIIAFADIGEFIDAPVSTYSSGMHVRLGFAIAIHGDPDIVLVDEILAVGDAQFQRKCLDKIREMRERGVTFILVTHNMQTVEALCNRVLLLDHGKAVMVGKPSETIAKYELLLKKDSKVPLVGGDETEFEEGELGLVYRYPDFGMDGQVEVGRIRLLGIHGEPKTVFQSGESLTIEASITARRQISRAKLVISFIFVEDRTFNERNLVLLGTKKMIDLKIGVNSLEINFGPVNFTTGEYKIAFHVFDEAFVSPYSQGHYGYFRTVSEFASSVLPGKGTPLCWSNPEIKVN